MRPTILIGIGSGGLRSIEAAWKLSQEVPDGSKPLVEYIYLETDKSNLPCSRDIVASSLTIDDIKASTSAIQQDTCSTSYWINNQTFPSNVFSGAGGSPIVGRLTLWDKSNRMMFIEHLNSAIKRLNRQTLEKPLVYVVGSFGGGTGSGVFLDIAYLVRDVLSNQVELQGLFMVPNMGLTDDVIYSNTICCLKELDYFNDDKHAFNFKWSANPPKGYEAENTPYDLIQIISASYNQTLAPVNYSQLHEEAGLFLYLNALGMYDVRRKSIVDATGNVIISKYTTFGISAIHYPESDLKEIKANAYAAEMLQHIIDTQSYYDSSYGEFKNIESAKPGIVNSVKSTFDQKFVEILEQWCNQISIVESGSSQPVELHLESLAKTLASGNSSYDEKRKLLYNNFKVGGEYYQQLKNLCEVNASDQVVNLIIDMTRTSLQKYQNINIAIVELNAIEECLSNILDFWNANGYTEKPQEWEQHLKYYIVNEILPMPLTFKLLYEKEKVYFDRIKFILLYGLAMHIFSEKLKKILTGLKGTPGINNSVVNITTTNRMVMPTKNLLNGISTVISNVISGSNPRFLSCTQVTNGLTEKLNKNNGNISYIYPEDNLSETLKKIDSDFRIANGQERFLKDITSNDDLYSFLFSIKTNKSSEDITAEVDLYNRIVSVYVSKIVTGNFSVSDAVQKDSYSDLVGLVENKALIPHLPVNPTGRNANFEDHKNIPHILVGYDGPSQTTLSSIENILSEKQHVFDFKITDKDRNKFSHEGLNNWLVFYKEFGRMSDGKSLNIIDDLRDFNNYANHFAAAMRNSGSSPEKFHAQRMPYISYSECHDQSLYYNNLALEQVSNKELEAAIVSFQYAMYWDMSNQAAINKVAELTATLKNETYDQRFDRYYTIATKSMDVEQDYPKAREYFMKALNLQQSDPNAMAKIRQLDTINQQIMVLIQQGDQMCQKNETLYNKCVLQNDIMSKPECIQSYNEVLRIYNEALSISKHDKDVKSKIVNVERRIKSLNN